MRDKNQNLDSSRARRCTLISGTNGLSKVVATRFADESGGLISRFAGLAKLLVISPDKGAETIIYLASSPKIAATTAFNVVRFLVKPEREQEFLNAHRKRSDRLAGLGKEAGTRRIDDLFSAKAEELSLFSPAGRQPRR